MRAEDVETVVRIHLESFPGFFLSFLGPRFLRLLYRSIHDDPEGLALVEETDSRIEGFAVGVRRQAGFYRRLIRRRLFPFAWAALGAAGRRPSVVPRLLRALRRPSEARVAAAEACLMSVAVLPGAEGGGVGRQLVEAFCRAMAGAGVEAVSLTTDADHNDRTNAFYTRLGFTLARTFVTPEGRRMNEYCKRVRGEFESA